MAHFKKKAPPAPTPPAPPPAVPGQRWLYETDEKPKKKHHWSRAYAGFIDLRDGSRVSKCPKGFPTTVAQRLINDGIEDWTDDPPGAWPHQIFVVHEGVLYQAVPTNPGRSYHAYPVNAEDLRYVPRDVRKKIDERAQALGCERELRRWIGR